MESNRIWAVVPVKRFSAAKSRLVPVLDAGERAELGRLMFEDVLDALVPCRDILAGVLVVTADSGAASLARLRGATVLADVADSGINAAVVQASQYILQTTDNGLMVVPSDIPQITRSAFAQAAAAVAEPRSIAIAAAAEDGGTNLFACRPAGVIPPQFGPRSFDMHYRMAQQAGLAVHTLHVPELSLDIDRPENLRTFLALKSNTRTHAYLSCVHVVDRLERLLRPNRRPLDPAVAEVMR